MKRTPNGHDWTRLCRVAQARGITISQATNGCGVTLFKIRLNANPDDSESRSHFGGLWDFPAHQWIRQCIQFIRNHPTAP